MNESTARPRHAFAIAAIIKNEAPYLAEWIAYHQLIGFTHFFIADNGSEDGGGEMLAEWARRGWVTTRRWMPEEKAQTSWYRYVLDEYGDQIDHLAFLDADEFLVHPETDRPLEWLSPVLARADVGAVAVNWRIFGSSGMRHRQPGGVLARFRRASRVERQVNCHVKSIVKPRHVQSMTAHAAVLEPGFGYVTADGQPAAFVDGKSASGRTQTVSPTPLKIYHFNVKSRDEFVDTKMTRGRANMGPNHSRDMNYFRHHDLNEEPAALPDGLFTPLQALIARLSTAAREGSALAATSSDVMSAQTAPPRFFVHIPKTAGTSFRLGAKQYLGEAHVWHDYGEAQRETAPAVVRWAYERRDYWWLWQTVRESRIALLAGHVPLAKYAHLAGLRDCFTFVREPLQRIASDYHHFARHHGYEGSFQDFYRRSDMVNRQSRFLESTRLEALGFVGITERYADSLALINDLYGWAVPGLKENLGHASAEHVYEIGADDQEALRALNLEDIRLYEQSLRIFETRLALWKAGQPFVHGAIQQCLSDRVVGWAWWASEDMPVELDVWVNGIRVGGCLANALRPGFLRWGAPRGAYIGFHLPLDAEPGDRVECRVALTGQSLGEQRIAATERMAATTEA
ncbi:glycosyltransferase family 2 protein [Salinicola halophilus]|uniref:glycosyltransferase family 2 protein n=1 Tax=Salinicola halophilus TaxID=184065 RepID=UPI000DA234BC|nr:glycosyltransferase family 2 protein [Salinicola halophilus]